MTKKTEAQHTINIAISEIPNTNDTKLIVQQVDESTGKEVNRKEMTLTNKSIEEVEAMLSQITTKYIAEGSLTEMFRKPFVH